MDLDNMQKPFIWRKKYEEQGLKIDEKQIELENKRRAEANRIELEKIKERRRLRDLEYQQKLNDGEFMQRQKEAEQHEHYMQQDRDFDLRQQRYRSKIRISNGRAEAIDLFTYYIDVFGAKVDDRANSSGYIQEEKIDLSDSPVELLNPCDWFNGLRQADLEALAPKIKTYMNSDCEQNQQYWKDLLDITRNEMAKLQAVKDKAESKASVCDLNPAVIPDVMALFEGRSIHELNEIEDEIRIQLKVDDPSIDVTFYKCVLSRLRAHRARIRLGRNHRKNLERQKSKILDNKNDDTKPTTSNDDRQDAEMDVDAEPMDAADEESSETGNAQGDMYEEARGKCIEEYKQGGYSPKMYRKSELNQAVVCVDYQKEFQVLCHNRHKVCNASSLDEVKKATMSREEREFIDAASKGMDNQAESTFSCEQPIRGPDNRAQTYIWADKYQPRKPRYFNRVHTGFEWNKYNQTHYDIDNPPPKVVQGYKFNIFYPDLIDKSKAPKFTIIPCKDDKDFCTIKFTAGPPYEDIAFRIVNREWNNSHKSGYRCQFINNMLQLWFQFKRYRYRR